MKKICLNCESVGKYRVPRELVEQQLGWKLDLPYHKGQPVWVQYKLPDVYLCKDCLLRIVNVGQTPLFIPDKFTRILGAATTFEEGEK